MNSLSLRDVPWSCAGSWLKLTARTGTDLGRLQISSCRMSPYAPTGKQWPHDLYEIALYKGTKEVPYEWTWTASSLVLTAKGNRGSVTLGFADPDTLVFESNELKISLLPCKSVPMVQRISASEGKIYDYRARAVHHLRGGEGTTVKLTATTTVQGETGPFHDIPYRVDFTGKGAIHGALRFTPVEGAWSESLPRVAEAVAATEANWQAWLKKIPVVPPALEDAALAAWYILWNTQIAPLGAVTRRTIYMSRNWMNQVWSWDNCFNALAVARADPELAFDQLRVMFDHQKSNGAFPDSVNDLFAQHTFVKPPIYGWTFMKLLERVGKTKAKAFAKEAIGPITRQTEWWYAQRDSDNNGLCEYLHGNESGWDNATIFDQGYPTTGADLQAHLVVQMEGLATMADILGKDELASVWRMRASEHLNLMVSKLWQKDRFVSPLNTKTTAKDTQSLLDRMPILLGARLPETIRKTLVKDLSPGGPFLTEWGPATQAPGSKLYEPDGYWRGPIWAPSTHLIFDGLLSAGETALARTVAERFCALCGRDGQMWENYNALTGEGLRCPGYSWTAASFLLMAEWLAENPVA
ncbi:MAG: trehalase family glycosidase [Verrucomicrobiota bacterium]|nr:trehalase family glycosidase [Verrucomicrobiota bacterium]